MPGDGARCSCGECFTCIFLAVLRDHLDRIDPRRELGEDAVRFAAFLVLRRVLRRRRGPGWWLRPIAVLSLLLASLLAVLAVACRRGAADHRPAAAPAVADRCARILLIAPAAPPASVTAIAGATG
jgi:hypothetical protein